MVNFEFSFNILRYTLKELTKYTTDTSINFAKCSTPYPIVTDKGIEDYWEALGCHHTQVREGQIDNEHIGLKTRVFLCA